MGISTSGKLLDLIQRCRNHDEAAWAEFRAWFGRVAARVLSRFSNLTPVEREEAQDDARVKVALEIEAGRITAETDGGVVMFIRTVVLNTARDAWRRRRPNDPLPPMLRDQSPSPAEQARFKAQLDCIQALSETWSVDNRFVFGMKLQQVPSTIIKGDLERLFGLFITVEAVDVRFFRLRAELRRRCEIEDSDD